MANWIEKRTRVRLCASGQHAVCGAPVNARCSKGACHFATLVARFCPDRDQSALMRVARARELPRDCVFV